MKLQLHVKLVDTINQSRNIQGAIAGYLEEFAERLHTEDVVARGEQKEENGDLIEWSFGGRGDML